MNYLDYLQSDIERMKIKIESVDKLSPKYQRMKSHLGYCRYIKKRSKKKYNDNICPQDFYDRVIAEQ